MSRKRINIDRGQFENLLSLQCTKDDIAGFFHCSIDTVERFCQRTYKAPFSDVCEEYRAEGRVSIRRTQFAMMEQGNTQMAIHLGKQYLGQADKVSADVNANVKHGSISKLIIYDPETGHPTQETITGAEADVEAYQRDPENYNGNISAFNLPVKDPDPDDLEKATGEKILTSMDGSKRLHLPYDGQEYLNMTIRTDKSTARISYPDDGRGGYYDN